MSTPSQAVHDSSVQAQTIQPALISEGQRLYWLVRRELWENRSIYIAPLVVAALVLFGSLISAVRLPGKMRAAAALSQMQQKELLQEPYLFAALLLMGATFVVAIFYCLEALYGERRDRSILFWKSLPVSDFTTVLSKAIIPVVVLPLVTFAVTVATQWLMLLMGTVVVMGSGQSVGMLWSQVAPVRMSFEELFHLVAIHGFWYAPIYCWLLLVSAWARRVPILWAALPLVAIGVIEKVAFNTVRLVSMVGERIASPEDVGPSAGTSKMSMDSLNHPGIVHLLINPSLWIGLALGAALLLLAARIRRNREPN
jgi:ABC-2 type transport system permease protein